MISYYKSSLISLFTKVQELHKNPKDFALCLEIQETLILKISYIERRIRQLKIKIESVKKSLRTKRIVLLTKEEAAALKSEIEEFSYKVSEYQYLIYVFKCIGDAIAHIYINKWDIKPMSMKESPGFISGKKGSRLERKAFREGIKRTKRPLILNDLTNCLRYGDITVPNNGKFTLIEMKSGKKKYLDNRSKKQKEKLENIGNYFSNDYTQNLYNKEGDFFRFELLSNEKNCVKKFNEIIERSLSNGFCYSKIEEGLFYGVFTKYDENILSKIIPDIRHSDEMFVALIHPSHFKGYYPITLTIKNPLAIYKFFQDSLSLLVFIDLQFLKQKLNEKKIDVEFLEGDWFLKLINLEPKDSELEYTILSKHFFNRVSIEFLSLKWFINEISHFLKQKSELEKLVDEKILPDKE